MKKNKGFTLVELLAVIVILAVIALISVPIITNVIEKSKKGAVQSSTYGLIEAAEIYYANNLSTGIKEDIEFICNGSKCISEDNKEIVYKGNIDSGIIKLYTDGKTTVCVEKDNYGAYKLATSKEVTVEKGSCNDDYTVDANVSKKEYDEMKDELNGIKTKMASTTATNSDIKTGQTAITSEYLTTSNLTTGTGGVNAIISLSPTYYTAGDAITFDFKNEVKSFLVAGYIVPETGTAAYKIWGSNDNSTWNYINQYAASTVATDDFYTVEFGYRYVKVQTLANSYRKSISIVY